MRDIESLEKRCRILGDIKTARRLQRVANTVRAAGFIVAGGNEFATNVESQARVLRDELREIPHADLLDALLSVPTV